MIALLLAVVLAVPTPLPDLTITSSQPGQVASGASFDHTYTVTNLGGTAAKYQTHDQFSTALTVLSIPSNCYVDSVLVRMRRQQAGVICNGVLAPGESVTLTETLRMKQVPWSGSVVVNRAVRSIVLESDFTNNAAYWAVAVAP